MQKRNFDPRRMFPPLCLIAAALLGIAACASTGRFTVFRQYCKKGFIGNDLSGQRIMVSPLITRAGIESGGACSPETVAGEAGRKRPDLQFEKSDDFIASYRARHGEDALDGVFLAFYKGAMVSLQSNPAFWKELNTDYLLVLKLNFGFKTKSVAEQTVREMQLEGELWDGDSMEVVWRSSVEGRYKGDRTTDADMILGAVSRLVEALPPVTHGYGKGSW